MRPLQSPCVRGHSPECMCVSCARRANCQLLTVLKCVTKVMLKCIRKARAPHSQSPLVSSGLGGACAVTCQLVVCVSVFVLSSEAWDLGKHERAHGKAALILSHLRLLVNSMFINAHQRRPPHDWCHAQGKGIVEKRPGKACAASNIY